jgi:uncharacterized protein (TIGR03435 family)
VRTILMRIGTALMLLLLGFIVAEPTLIAQVPAFEVASIKLSRMSVADFITQPRFAFVCLVPCVPGERVRIDGDRLDIRFMSPDRLILLAYRIKPYQLFGPSWMQTQKFDIAAKIPSGVTKDKVPEMVQALLAERFKLAIHRENKEQSVYALVVGKSGLNLEESTANSDAPNPDKPGNRKIYTPEGEATEDSDGNTVVSGGQLGPIEILRGSDGITRTLMLGLTMPGLAELLTPHEDHLVVDRTNLMGIYRFEYDHARSLGSPAKGVPLGGQAAGSPSEVRMPGDSFGDPLFQAIKKAGLKLEPSKALVETITVDHLEKTPSEN